MNKKWSLLLLSTSLSLVVAIPAFAADGVNSTRMSENRMNATGTRTYTNTDNGTFGLGTLNTHSGTDTFSNQPGMRSGTGTIGTLPGTVGTTNQMNNRNNVRPLDLNPLDNNGNGRNRTNQYRTNAAAANNDNGMDWGWLGLIGLAGLVGLRGRNPERT